MQQGQHKVPDAMLLYALAGQLPSEANAMLTVDPAELSCSSLYMSGHICMFMRRVASLQMCLCCLPAQINKRLTAAGDGVSCLDAERVMLSENQ
jgi:hypothetical protein